MFWLTIASETAPL